MCTEAPVLAHPSCMGILDGQTSNRLRQPLTPLPSPRLALPGRRARRFCVPASYASGLPYQTSEHHNHAIQQWVHPRPPPITTTDFSACLEIGGARLSLWSTLNEIRKERKLVVVPHAPPPRLNARYLSLRPPPRPFHWVHRPLLRLPHPPLPP